MDLEKLEEKSLGVAVAVAVEIYSEDGDGLDEAEAASIEEQEKSLGEKRRSRTMGVHRFR